MKTIIYNHGQWKLNNLLNYLKNNKRSFLQNYFNWLAKATWRFSVLCLLLREGFANWPANAFSTPEVFCPDVVCDCTGLETANVGGPITTEGPEGASTTNIPDQGTRSGGKRKTKRRKHKTVRFKAKKHRKTSKKHVKSHKKSHKKGKKHW